MIAGLEMPSSGRILLGGGDVTFKRASQRDIAFVFQLFALYPHKNVRANIAYPLKCQGARARRCTGALRKPRASCASTISWIGRSRAVKRRPQRVALGRAIVRQPLAFLLDEPLGASMQNCASSCAASCAALHDRLRATMVFVTHDQNRGHVHRRHDRGHEPRRDRAARPPQEIYDRPATLFVADFIGSPPMNFIGFRGE